MWAGAPKIRPLAPWGAGLVITFVAGAVWHRVPMALADPAACPGLGEAVAIGGARLANDLPLATILQFLNVVGLIVTLAGAIRLIDRVAGSLSIALAVSIAMVAMPIFTPALEPAPTLAIGAACWAALGVLRPRRAIVAAAIGLAVLAATAPELLLVCAPTAVAAPRAAVFHAVSVAFAGVGLAPVALAALGLFARRRDLRMTRQQFLVAAALIPLGIVGARADLNPARVLGPTIVAFWVLAALGLRELVAALSDGLARRVAPVVCVIALPVLTLASRPEWIVPGPAPSGHEFVTRRDFVRLLNSLEPGTALAQEDAVTALLLRSAASLPSVAAKAIRVAPRQADAINSLLAAHVPVAAMPRAQRDLQREGLQIDPNRLQVPDQALAALRPGGACGAIGPVWQDLRGLASSDVFSLVANGPDARGPVALYLAGPAPLSPAPADWPDLARRGFFVATYDLADADGRRRFSADSSDNQGPADPRLANARYVAYVEVWRVPGAPLDLSVALGQRPALALGRTRSGAPEPGLRLCPSFGQPAGHFSAK